MASDKKVKEFFRSALDRMFVSAGFPAFDEDFVKQDDWYLQREWTEEQEREYRSWLINECRTKLRMTKKAAEIEASYFLLMWGWKTKYIDENLQNNEKLKINATV